MSQSSSSIVTNLQSAIDHISKLREDHSTHGGAHTSSSRSSDLHERVSNLERSIVHILTRLDRAEDSKRVDRGPNNIDEVLSSTERILREALIELLKQQNIILQYRQENDSLREKLSIKKETPTSASAQATQAQKPAVVPQHPRTQSVTSTQPIIRPVQTAQPAKKAAAKPAPSTQHKRFEDEGNEPDVDAEPVQHRLPVEFPPGYNHRGRRFSVAGESFNPTTDLANVQRNIIKKSNDARNRIRTVITSNILFKNLDEEQLDDLIDEMFEVRLKPDEIIIRQGDVGDNFYVVDSGELYVLYKDVVVATIGVGKGFGEIALMYMCPRTATVKAKSEVILWGMSRATFRRSLMAHAIRKRELYESFLERVPLLESLLPYERSIIADALESRTFKDSELIIKEGEKGDAFYIIEKGRVVVTKANVEVKSCSEGDYFGELALLTDQPRAANVRAIGQVRVLYLRREDFAALMGPCEEILKRNTQIYNQINASLSSSGKLEAKPKPQSVAALVAEFVQEETEYFHLLQITQKEFLRPMRKAVENKSLPISDEEVNQLFPQLEMIVNVHGMFEQQLPEISSNPALFGKFLFKAAPGLRFNAEFNREWDNIVKVLDKYKDDASLQAFFKAPSRSSYDISTLLSATHERLAKVLINLRDFIAFAPHDKDAIAAMEKIESL